MLLFLEALRAAGIVTVMFEPTPIQSAILGEQRFDSYSMTLLHSLYLQLSKVFNDARQTSLPNMSDTTNDQIHNLAVIVTLKQLEPTSSIKLGLSKSSSIVSRAIEHTEKHVLSDNISQLLNFVKRLLQVSSVAPIQFMSRILWMTAVSMGALSLLREHCQSIGPKSQVYEATALCLDIFLCTLLHRDGPRCSSILPPDIEDSNFENFKQDVNLALFLFATLLPADDPSTWRCCLVFNDDGSAEFGSKNGHPEPNLLADFLLQLFEYLISILEKLVHQQHQHQQQSEFSFTAILAGVLFEILSLQIPTTILMQEPIRIIKVLDDILDLQNNSTLVTLPAWHKLFSSNDCPHFLSTLLARINTLQRFF
ncbi:hypothetical protein BCR41DRAFT_133939 [Lobosporangium transversale]|uniref:Uncharacterized protein n=1 Tax=Lobosporangium transversale TaxID=64571 RepID=A0A1Y2GFS1_9FUNG|nr:hypothetical protein BCR41DRAFT_133939 [Lobosporangium transversale]ORZ09658.1 hypothetical protein BCR41DRAFT_133939 [Lobosporangium transversale]|eukprot:XP_021878928.1 hypothetical protein BCR41DRAFT_133939 [Lobosporangium transversale]